VLNDHELAAGVDEQVEIVLQLASGALSREGFTDWLRHHVQKMQSVGGA
jgi:prophage maintenance system killer protein